MKQITKSDLNELEIKVVNKIVDKFKDQMSGSSVLTLMLTLMDVFKELSNELFETDETIEIVTDKEQ